MKNKIIIRLAAVSAMLFSLGIAGSLKAQCTGYTIKNISNCEATINYVYSCVGGGTCASATGVVLLENVGQLTIPACTCASGKCTLSVTITKSGTLTLPTPVTVSNSSPSASYPSACPGSHSMSLNAGTGVVTIN